MAQAASVSFERDVRPLFRAVDIEHMSAMEVMLDDYGFMSQRANAEKVRDYLTGKAQPQMPPGGPYWKAEQIELFSRWIDGGCPP
jgi:hypothetical protein